MLLWPEAISGYGKNVEYVTMDNPQPSPKHYLFI
jgi:hypothetical protein